MTAAPPESDAALASRLATQTGHRLVELRRNLADSGAPSWLLMDEGDATAHAFLAAELTSARLEDALLSEEGADELKGWELAVEHINSGHELMKKLAPKVSKGLLGKKVNLLSADSGAKPNNAENFHRLSVGTGRLGTMMAMLLSATARASFPGTRSRR